MKIGKVKLVAPEILRELVDDLMREVLLKTPKNIPKFCADYFKRLLAQRAGMKDDLMNDI